MRSLGFKKWVVNELDRNLAKSLAEECNVEPIVVYKNWINFNEEIIGDDEAAFEWEE